MSNLVEAAAATFMRQHKLWAPVIAVMLVCTLIVAFS